MSVSIEMSMTIDVQNRKKEFKKEIKALLSNPITPIWVDLRTIVRNNTHNFITLN